MIGAVLIAAAIVLGVLNVVGILALPLWLILLPLAPIALGLVVSLVLMTAGLIGMKRRGFL